MYFVFYLTGLVLSWTMDNLTEEYADIECYHVYAYQEIATKVPKTWRFVGDVVALPLPMAILVSQVTFF